MSEFDEVMKMIIEEMKPYNRLDFENEFTGFWKVFNAFSANPLIEKMPPELIDIIKVGMAQAFASGLDVGVSYTLDCPDAVREENKTKLAADVEHFRKIVDGTKKPVKKKKNIQ